MNPNDHAQLVARADELLARTTEQWSRPDLFDLLQHLFCETDFYNLTNATILSWFPAEVLREAIVWLEQEVRAGEEEMLEDMLDESTRAEETDR